MAEPVYAARDFPAPPEDRPYIFHNMVATIDGRTIDAGRDKAVQGLGSETDHATMHHLEAWADGIMQGAGTIRATPRFNLPEHVKRYCVTKSGHVEKGNGFFEGESWLIMPGNAQVPSGFDAVQTGADEVDWPEALRRLRHEHGIEYLLCEGGARLNGEMIRHGCSDELFLTLAPKVRLGSDAPTYAEGDALPELQQFGLVSHQAVGSEVFLRYRRHH